MGLSDESLDSIASNHKITPELNLDSITASNHEITPELSFYVLKQE